MASENPTGNKTQENQTVSVIPFTFSNLIETSNHIIFLCTDTTKTRALKHRMLTVFDWKFMEINVTYRFYWKDPDLVFQKYEKKKWYDGLFFIFLTMTDMIVMDFFFQFNLILLWNSVLPLFLQFRFLYINFFKHNKFRMKYKF
jgi:uncharacterized protein YcfL